MAQRRWYIPPGWAGDVLNIPGLNAAYDRSAINNLYIQVVSTNPLGRQGEAMVLKLQLDYIAALERGFRTRQASSVRCRIHAAARRNGHSAALYDTGSGTLVIWLNQLLSAAHSDPEGP